MSGFIFPIVVGIILFSVSTSAQVDDFCTEAGLTPGLDSPFARVPYIYGRVVLRNYAGGSKMPRVVVILTDSQQSKRLRLENSGNYCFKRSGSNGTLTVEVDGVEVARRTYNSFGAVQQREDFEVLAPTAPGQTPPGVVSAKSVRPPNEKTVALYQKASDAERERDAKRFRETLREILAVDPQDTFAWARLGKAYEEDKAYTEAEAAFRKALEIDAEYLPAWLGAALIRMDQKQYEPAIVVLQHAITLDPASARAYQLLGESYLFIKKGTLAVDALNQAIKLDPIGMAECHLNMAHLYELAGAKQLAAKEYKIFLTKVPDHPDKKKFEKYIKENS